MAICNAITFANEHKFIFQVIKSPETPTPEPSKVVDKSAGETIFDDGESIPTPNLGEEVKNKTLFDDKVIIPPDVEEDEHATVFDDEAARLLINYKKSKKSIKSVYFQLDLLHTYLANLDSNLSNF